MSIDSANRSKNTLQVQVLLKWLEIFVGVQKSKTVLDAIRSDDGIDRLAHGDAFLSQRPKIRGTFKRDGCVEQLHDGQRQEQLAGLHKVPVFSESLQYFDQYQVTGSDRCLPQQ